MAERDAAERETRQEGRRRPGLDVQHARTGDRFDRRYLLHRLLASGGAADVYSGEHIYTKRCVAIKVPHEAATVSRARVGRELEALGRVRGEGVVEMLDAGEVDDIPYIAFELLDGRTLAGLLAARGQLSIASALKVGIEVARVLEHCHLHGVVHRDVKPSNMFVTPNARRQLVLLDFGIAKLVDDGAPREKLTQENVLLGTPEYMAPESLVGSPAADHRVDVYGLGVTLYECVTGAVPFDGKRADVVKKLSTSAPRGVRELRPETPSALADAIDRSVARAPEDRYQSMAEMRLALEASASAGIDGVNLYQSYWDSPQSGTSKPVAPKQTFADGPGGISRRRHRRAPYVTLARLSRADGETVDGRVEEISEGGLQFVGEHPVTGDEPLRIRFALPSSGRVTEVKAAPRWSRTRRGVHVAGFEFTEIADGARDEVRAYVAIMCVDRHTP